MLAWSVVQTMGGVEAGQTEIAVDTLNARQGDESRLYRCQSWCDKRFCSIPQRHTSKGEKVIVGSVNPTGR
jgi:hypothetical protein